MGGTKIHGGQIRDGTVTDSDIAENAIGASEIASDSICGQDEVASVSGDDCILVSKTDDSGNLKQVKIMNISDAVCTTQTFLQSTEHGYRKSGNVLIYIPWYQTTEKTSPNYLDQHVAPFNGKLKTVHIRSDSSMGSTIVGIHIGSNGNAEISTTALETASVTASENTTATFSFSSSSHFSVGDLVGISIDPSGNHGYVNVTCVWEYSP